jgi:hypothetical protein
LKVPAQDFLDACPPPWKAFPDIPPEDLVAYLKQGLTEAWFDQRWRPFWSSLNDEQREQYLRHWSASPAWRDALSVFSAHEGIDLATEWQEFEQELRQRDSQSLPKTSFWQRLWRRS